MSSQATIFHYGSISLITDPCRSSHLRAMEVAKEAGALLSYDPNLRVALWPSAEEAKTQIMSIWDQADIIKISDVELEFLTGHDGVDDNVVMTLWRPQLKLLLVTLGANGCRYYTKVNNYANYAHILSVFSIAVVNIGHNWTSIELFFLCFAQFVGFQRDCEVHEGQGGGHDRCRRCFRWRADPQNCR